MTRNPAFMTMARGPWNMLHALVSAIGQHDAGTWSQARIALYTKYCIRTVRTHVRTLLDAGILVAVYSRDPRNGHTWIAYGWGPVALEAFDETRAAWPEGPGPKKASARAPTQATTRSLTNQETCDRAAKIAPGPPANLADKQIPDPREHSCVTAEPASLDEERDAKEALEDLPSETIAAAVETLTEHSKRGGVPVPRRFSRARVALVARCIADTGASREMLRLALIGAWLSGVSDGPPSDRFVWGHQEHFLAHVARGRAKRDDVERNAKPRALEVAPPVRTGTAVRGFLPPPAELDAFIRSIPGIP